MERIANRIWLMLMNRSLRKRLYLPEYPVSMPQEALESCSVVKDRELLILRLGLQQNPIVAEVGVQAGNFSRFLLDELAPSELHLFDMHLARHNIQQKFDKDIVENRVFLHEGDSSSEISKLPATSFDLIYIDGDHSYEGVKKDISASVSKLAPNGFLVFNDYTFWSPCENIQYGTLQAINELCNEGGWKVTHLALHGFMYCDIALQKSS